MMGGDGRWWFVRQKERDEKGKERCVLWGGGEGLTDVGY